MDQTIPEPKWEPLGVEELPFVGGRLCLDFVNTANWIGESAVDDRLLDARDVISWAHRRGIVSSHRAPADATGLQDVLDLRSEIRAFVQGAADGSTLIESAAARGTVLELGRGGSVTTPDPLVVIAMLVAASAIELVATGAASEVKACPGERCGWLFADVSPARRRRWCSMQTCGNRNKAKHHHARRR